MSTPKGGFIPHDYSDTEYFKRTIAELEAVWRAGSPLALSDAVNLCKEHQCAVWPAWVTTALAGEHEAAIAGRRSKRGRQASIAAYERDRHMHVLRWHNARVALANRDRLPADKFAATREGAFEWVSKLLRGTVGRGEPSSVEASYKMVEKAIRDGQGARFGLSSRNFDLP